MKILFTWIFTLQACLLLAVFQCYGQSDKLTSSFLKDSIYLAEEVKYSLSYMHPKDYQIIFPDTNYDFSPFELVKKRAFNTISTDSTSLDSAIYYLRTFKASSPLALSLPIIILNESGDSTVVYSNQSSIGLRLQILGDPQQYQLLPDTAIAELPPQFNYPYFLLFGIGGLGIVLSTIYFFRKTITQRYRLYMLRKSHVAFLKIFEKLEKNLLTNNKLTDLEQIIGEWKIYLSRLEDSPINTYTTTEIVSIFQNEELSNTLQHLDRCIYGSSSELEFQKSLSVLKRFSAQRFQKRKKEVRNV